MGGNAIDQSKFSGKVTNCRINGKLPEECGHSPSPPKPSEGDGVTPEISQASQDAARAAMSDLNNHQLAWIAIF